jgi:hypothetical protein
MVIPFNHQSGHWALHPTFPKETKAANPCDHVEVDRRVLIQKQQSTIQLLKHSSYSLMCVRQVGPEQVLVQFKAVADICGAPDRMHKLWRSNEAWIAANRNTAAITFYQQGSLWDSDWRTAETIQFEA